MIINIRGTSGSGKSTLVRALMADCLGLNPQHSNGRKQPILYRGLHRESSTQLSFIGHYETACGGCDTIPNLDLIAEHVDREARHGYNVVFEGLLWSAETRRTLELASRHDLVVLALDIDLQVCVDSVNARRWAKNPEKPGVNPKNTASKHSGTRSCVRKLRENGVHVHVYQSRDPALAMARDLLAGRAVLPPRAGALPDQATA